MAKNIEININANGTSYEALYPKTTAAMVSAGTFNGSFTFSTAPACSTDPSGPNYLVRKGFLDTAISGMATQSWVNQQLSSLGGGNATIVFHRYRGTGSSNFVIKFAGKGKLYAFYVNVGEVGPNVPPVYMSLMDNPKAIYHIDSGKNNRAANLIWDISSVNLDCSPSGIDYLNASGVIYPVIGFFGDYG